MIALSLQLKTKLEDNGNPAKENYSTLIKPRLDIVSSYNLKKRRHKQAKE
jgi:hypothetical protein